MAVLAAVSISAWLGVASSSRLAEVRAHAGSLRTSTVLLEARAIASDWATLLVIVNISLAIAVVVTTAKRRRRV